ncbi:RNA 2',3'-cyclic phosphodiesterase [Treponema sp. TIM-1]|uniref:RNA 2',3'-cyclic phosphodiesterase n=1 Tax=Treponema sp. TIM-1 TaxID=2898417 RepID=UPI0039802750
MRTFVALELPPEFIPSLHQIQARLQDRYPHFRWSREENHHITLAFLGEVDEKGVALLQEALQETLQNTAAFSISAGRIITFPPGGAVRILALDIERGKNDIRNLAACFEKKLAALGEREAYSFRKPETRPYTPHITLARKGGVAVTLPGDERNWSIHAQGVIRKVTVFKSDLYREGPHYTALAVFPLKPPEGPSYRLPTDILKPER